MTTTCVLIVFIALMLFAAWAYANGDAITIKQGMDIDHTGAWIERAGFATICIVIALIVTWNGWMLLGLPLVAYGTFTPAFRYLLNKARGKHPCYVSPSNWYDKFWLDATWDPAMSGTMHWNEMLRTPLSSMPKLFRDAVHIAGGIAYIVEVCALILGIYITNL